MAANVLPHRAHQSRRPGIAGVDAETGKRIWNGNWQVRWNGPSEILLSDRRAIFRLRLLLHPEKPPVIHGENGVSQKAAGAGQASHYISLHAPD